MRLAPRRATAWLTASALVAVAALAASGGGLAQAAPDLPQWPADPDWQSYVPGPDSLDVAPVAVTRTVGDVTGADSLVGGGGPATLRMTAGGSPAVVVLDYGKEMGGTFHVDLAGDAGAVVRTDTSEALRFLTTNTPTTLAADAAAGATDVKVNSVASFWNGARIVIDGQERTVTNVGTAAQPPTALAVPVSAGDTTLHLESVAGFAPGAPVSVDTGATAETGVVQSAGTAAGPRTTLVYPGAAGHTVVHVASTAGFASGEKALVGDEVVTVDAVGTATPSGRLVADTAAGDTVAHVTSVEGFAAGDVVDVAMGQAGAEAATIASVGTPAVSTSLTGPAAPPGPDDWGPMIQIASGEGFAQGDDILIEPGPNSEEAVIQMIMSWGPTTMAILDAIENTHPAGSMVVNLGGLGTGITFTAGLANAHAGGTAYASPTGGTGLILAAPLAGDQAADSFARGAGGGVTLAAPLAQSHAVGAPVASSGTGVTFTPALTAAAAAGGAVVGEDLYNGDRNSPDTFTLAGAQTYTGTVLHGGFRFQYIALTTPGTVTVSRVGLDFMALQADADDYEGYFVSSENDLNEMWYAGVYTTQLDSVPVGVASCFTKPVMFDGAKRDRAIWTGDMWVTGPAAMVSLGSYAHDYVTGTIDYVYDLQGPTGRLTSAVGFQGCGGFDYAMTYHGYSLLIAIQYYRYTGDEAYITGLLPQMELAMDHYATFKDANGLIVTNDNDYNQTNQRGEVTEYNVVYYETLQDMAWLEDRVGTQAKADEYRADAAALKEAINAHLFDPVVGLYVHSSDDPGDNTPDDLNTYPLDGNMNAIRMDIAPADQVQGILDFFQERWVEHGSEMSQGAQIMADPYGHTIEPMNNNWEMLARIKSGDAAGALELMRRLWGLQIDRDSGFYTGTFWEFVMSDGLPSEGFDSLAHAWGAAPTVSLTESVVGATAVEPGYDVWQVKPQPVDIEWAAGQVPTPHGGLEVKWAQDTATDKFHMQVNAPAGTSGEVWVPLLDAAAQSGVLAGQAEFLRHDGAYDVYLVRAGTVEFSSLLVDKTALQAGVADGERLSPGDYTVASWPQFEDALQAARAVLADPAATQAEVDAALAALTAAQAGLVAVPALKYGFADAKATFTLGTTADLVWQATKEHALFDGSVTVDGVALTAAQRTVAVNADGGTVVTLRAAYLQTLAVGDHQLTVGFAGGALSSAFKVAAALPKTGADATAGTLVTALFILAIGLVVTGTGQVMRSLRRDDALV
jgi:hypothetical protein